jgi:hypothetical protein
MVEFIIKTRVYKQLLSKFNKTLPFTYLFVLEFMLMAYNKDNLIKYPKCFNYPGLQFIKKRCAITLMIRGGYLINIGKRKQIYKLTLRAENLCRDFMNEFKDELFKYNLSL